MERQKKVREAECHIRRDAVATARWLSRCFGKNLSECADLLSVAISTLRKWIDEHKKGKLLILNPRGRKILPVSREITEQIRVMLALLGPCTSIAKLRANFPMVPNEHLEEIRRDFKIDLGKNSSWYVNSMRWTKPGTVWAMDFTKPPVDIDNIYPKVLVIRDLSSGMMLQIIAVERETTESVIHVLKVLFEIYGAPLVLKSDNGSPFISEDMAIFLNDCGVLQLFSPPGMPKYNASVEAGIGSLKTYAHHSSARFDRAGHWNCDDLEAAKCGMNNFSRPNGINSPSPIKKFNERVFIDEEQRLEFYRRFRGILKEVVKQRGLGDFYTLKKRERRSIQREALAETLMKLEYLTIKKRRVSPPFRSLKVI